MIVELTKNNLYELKNTLLNLAKLEQELANNPFAKVLLYKEENKIVAYLYYSDIYDRAEINQLEVAVSHRNCGKASKLLEKLITLVEKDITLEVKISNIPAIQLYEKFNFQKKAIRKGYYEGIDGILMERKNQA